MARKMKWKRDGPGSYTSGDFQVTRNGYRWNLTRNSTDELLIGDLSSKKEAQELAAEEPAKVKRKETSTESTSVDSFMLLRQEVTSLSFAILGLKEEIRQLHKAVDNLAQSGVS